MDIQLQYVHEFRIYQAGRLGQAGRAPRGGPGGALRYGNDFGPGSTISIVVERDNTRQARDAIWWLYLQQTGQGLKPHKDYFSVNTRYDKLPKKAEYRKSRCIVPATAFVESQDGKRPHLLEPAHGNRHDAGSTKVEWPLAKRCGAIFYAWETPAPTTRIRI